MVQLIYNGGVIGTGFVQIVNGEAIVRFNDPGRRDEYFLASKCGCPPPQLWLKLVTRTDYTLARELVAGLGEDLLPKDERFWEITQHGPRCAFDDAVSRALETEREQRGVARMEERIVQRIGRSGSAILERR